MHRYIHTIEPREYLQKKRYPNLAKAMKNPSKGEIFQKPSIKQLKKETCFCGNLVRPTVQRKNNGVKTAIAIKWQR